MVECEFCEEEFEDETELHLHWEEKHEEELNSHQEEKIKKAKREKKKERERKRAKRKEYRNYAVLGVILVALVGGGAMVAPQLTSSMPEAPGNIGPAGSAHYHADFSVVVDGEEIDFSRSEYQVVSSKAHVEGGNGDVVHSHATGAHFRFFMRTLGFDYNSTFLQTPGDTYREGENGEVRMFVNTDEDWREIEPTDFRFETGDQILLTYGNYTEEEIGELQSQVTTQSQSMS